MLSLNKRKWRLLNQNGNNSILDQLIANRQVGNLEDFLHPDFDTGLHDPFLMPDMQKAVDILRQAHNAQRKVMIIGDYDADGITGTALLYELCRAIGLQQVVCRLPHRIHDGYGLQPHIIEEAIRDQIDVILTVDNGVSSLEAITLAKQRGMDVIVCDHHTIPETLPPADAILHPRYPEGAYPFHDLTGVGVAYKLAQALCPRMLPSTAAEKFLKWNLDLVAIGTVADCATVMGENRVLIAYGLKVIELIGNQQTARRPGLQQMLKHCLGNSKSPSYDTVLIGFRIAPRINAAGRISHPDSSLKLLTTRNALEAELLAQELQTLNTRRQQQTMESVHQAKEQLADRVLHEKILIARNKDWHPGIVGLIAGRLTEAFHRPSIIFHEKNNGTLVASARSISQFNIIEAITKQQDILLRFGGHSQAAGCSLDISNYEEFCERMQALANDALDESELYPVLVIDCILPLEQLTWNVKQGIDSLEPYGIGNTRPLFVLSDMEVQRINPVGRDNAHLQLWFRQGDDATLKGIAFQQGHLAAKLSQGDRLHVACHLQENNWNGTRSLEIEVVDLQRRTDETAFMPVMEQL